jgi:hypothetical protein
MNTFQQKQARELANHIFEEIALCMGGIFLLNHPDDRIIWAIANSIEDLYLRTIRELRMPSSSQKTESRKDGTPGPHPAIQGLLRTIAFEESLQKEGGS